MYVAATLPLPHHHRVMLGKTRGRRRRLTRNTGVDTIPQDQGLLLSDVTFMEMALYQWVVAQGAPSTVLTLYAEPPRKAQGEEKCGVDRRIPGQLVTCNQEFANERKRHFKPRTSGTAF